MILVLVLDPEMALANAIAETELDAILGLVPRMIHSSQQTIDPAEPMRWLETNHQYLVDVALVPQVVLRGAVDAAFALSTSFPNPQLHLRLRPYRFRYRCAWRMAIDHASTNWECATMMIVWQSRIATWYVVVLPLVDADDLGVA